MRSAASCSGTATSSASVTPASCSIPSPDDGRDDPSMNSALALQVMRFGFLALLWLFVFVSLRVIRGDLRTSGQPRIAVPPPARRRGGRSGAPRSAPAPSHLLVTAGDLMGTRITLSGSPVLIGRAADSTLVL